MAWNPLLMKKFLKSEVYGSHEQCMRPTGVAEKSNIAAKKKEKRETQILDVQTHNPNAAILSRDLCLYIYIYIYIYID